MDRYVYRALLAEQDSFVAQDQHRVVEIDGCKVASRVVGEVDLKAWIEENTLQTAASTREVSTKSASPATSSLRLLIGSPRVLEQNIWPLPVRQTTFECLMSHWNVPDFMLRAICRHIPVATGHRPDLSSKSNGILLRTNLSFSWQYSMALLHDEASNATTCVIFGLKAAEVLTFLDAIKTFLSGCTDSDVPLHLVIPAILMDIAIDVLSQDAESRRAHLLNVYQATGLHGFNHIDRRQSKDDVQLELDLLTKLTHNLTSLSDACAGIKAVCKTQFRFLDTLMDFGFEQRHPEEGSGNSAAELNTTHFQCRQHLRFMQQVLLGAESKLDYIQESAQCQVHTMYSLIEQRESRTHIEHADASRRLAAQSYQIAELTRRDSIDMRIIAAVTMLFLPGTFMATLFSASFFNFSPRNETARVSPWIWLYFTLTVVLTVIVLAGWYYFARHENQHANKKEDSDSWQASIKEKASMSKQMHDHAPSPRESSVMRPYLSGSIAGLPAFATDIKGGDFFAKELDIHIVSPKNTFRSKPW